MKSRTISPVIVAVIGTLACLLSVGLITYFLIMPSQTQISGFNDRIAAVGNDADPATKIAAQKDVVKATNDVVTIKNLWHVKEVALMPAFNIDNRYAAWKQLSIELAQNLGPRIEKWIPHTGVASLSNITIGAPPASPNDISDAPLTIPISGGSLAVAGGFRAILNHIVLWNNFNRLVLIDNLALSGNSPFMQGTYSAEVIIFPQGGKLGNPIPQAGTAGGTTSGFGGGMPGGPPPGFGGGMPGGPPPGMGGHR